MFRRCLLTSYLTMIFFLNRLFRLQTRIISKDIWSYFKCRAATYPSFPQKLCHHLRSDVITATSKPSRFHTRAYVSYSYSIESCSSFNNTFSNQGSFVEPLFTPFNSTWSVEMQQRRCRDGRGVVLVSSVFTIWPQNSYTVLFINECALN